MSRYRKLSTIDSIVIHCAGTPNGEPLRALTIDKWHHKRGSRRALEARLGEGNWPAYAMHQPYLRAIGYHFVINVDGVVETGRRLTETGAHTVDPRYPKGHKLHSRWNVHAVAICLVGTNAFTARQWVTLAKLVTGLQDDKDLNIQRVIGHRDVSPDINKNGLIDPPERIKICPGFNVADWLQNDMQPLDDHLLTVPATT